MKTKTKTLVNALQILARDIESTDGVANAAIFEASKRLSELEREKAELVAQVEVLKRLAEPAIRLMRATGNSSGWHKKADELDLVVNSKLTTQCLNQIKAEAVQDAANKLAKCITTPPGMHSSAVSVLIKMSDRIRKGG